MRNSEVSSRFNDHIREIQTELMLAQEIYDAEHPVDPANPNPNRMNMIGAFNEWMEAQINLFDSQAVAETTEQINTIDREWQPVIAGNPTHPQRGIVLYGLARFRRQLPHMAMNRVGLNLYDNFNPPKGEDPAPPHTEL